jgi:hypothetical protein
MPHNKLDEILNKYDNGEWTPEKTLRELLCFLSEQVKTDTPRWDEPKQNKRKDVSENYAQKV